jgi:hypothetical protein
MISRRGWCGAALGVGMAGLLAVSTGMASASARGLVYGSELIGPNSSEATCDATSASLNDPPDSYATPCFYSATYPNTTTPDPGWYFHLRYLVD